MNEVEIFKINFLLLSFHLPLTRILTSTQISLYLKFLPLVVVVVLF